RATLIAECLTVAYPRLDSIAGTLGTSEAQTVAYPRNAKCTPTPTLIPDLERELAAAGPKTSRLPSLPSSSRGTRALAGAIAFVALAGLFYLGTVHGWLTFTPE